MSTVLFDTNALIDICRENHVARLEVFGSTARGEANEDSDVDLLVEFSNAKACLPWYRWNEKCRPRSAERWICLLKPQFAPTYARESIATAESSMKHDESFYLHHILDAITHGPTLLAKNSTRGSWIVDMEALPRIEYPRSFPPREFYVEPEAIETAQRLALKELIDTNAGETAIDTFLKEHRALLAACMNFTQFGRQRDMGGASTSSPASLSS